jgi:DUF1365 family protein
MQLGFKSARIWTIFAWETDFDMVYEWHVAAPAERFRMAIVSFRGQERVFDARLTLERRELTRGSMLCAQVRFPWLIARVIQAIHWQAFRLWRNKCPFYAHPKHRQGSEARQP